MTFDIRERIVAYARGALFRAGLLGLFHRIRNRRTFTVLMFHRVLPRTTGEFQRAEAEYTLSVEGFGRCLDFVKRHYNVVNLARMVDAGAGKQALPPRAALITFDDGWRDTILYALPELRKRCMPAVLFLATEVLDLGGARWWQDAVVEIAGDAERSRRLAQELGRVLPDGRNLQGLTTMLADRPPIERDELVAHYVPIDGMRQLLTRDDASALDQQCLALAAHGHTHAPLTHVREPMDELRTSRDRIRDLGGWPAVMSFPHGAFNAEVVFAARSAGFEWVFTSDGAINPAHALDGSRLLARIHVPENRWTCNEDGIISEAKLASFLFFRPIRFAG